MNTGAWSGVRTSSCRCLRRVLEGDARHLEVAGARVDVAGRDGRPGEVDLGHGVVQAHHRGEVGLGALVPLAGEVVEHVGGGAVAGVEHAAVADHAVVGRVAAGQQDVARDHGAGSARRGPRAAWPCRPRLSTVAPASWSSAGQGRRVVGDADLGEHAHGLLVDELLLGLGQVLEPRSRHVSPPDHRAGGPVTSESLRQAPAGSQPCPYCSQSGQLAQQDVALGRPAAPARSPGRGRRPALGPSPRAGAMPRARASRSSAAYSAAAMPRRR